MRGDNCSGAAGRRSSTVLPQAGDAVWIAVPSLYLTCGYNVQLVVAIVAVGISSVIEQRQRHTTCYWVLVKLTWTLASIASFCRFAFASFASVKQITDNKSEVIVQIRADILQCIFRSTEKGTFIGVEFEGITCAQILKPASPACDSGIKDFTMHY